VELDIHQWHDIFVQSPIGLAIVSKEGKIVELNDSMANILGYSHSELEGKMTVEDITHPADIKSDMEMIEKVVLGKIDYFEMIKRYISKPGKVVWVRSVVHGIYHDHQLVNLIAHVIPLVNGDRVKAMTSQDEFVSSNINKISFKNFMKENWKWALTILCAGVMAAFSFFHKWKNMERDMEEMKGLIEKALNIENELKKIQNEPEP
jgi:PAS domain S-box-containing protein